MRSGTSVIIRRVSRLNEHREVSGAGHCPLPAILRMILSARRDSARPSLKRAAPMVRASSSRSLAAPLCERGAYPTGCSGLAGVMHTRMPSSVSRQVRGGTSDTQT